MQEMVIYGVSFDMVGKQPIVLLKTRDGNKFLPIWVGHPEAAAILMKLQGANTPRPMTHDLISDMLSERPIPGLTDTSLLPQAAEAAGIGFDELVGRILALCRSPSSCRSSTCCARPSSKPTSRATRASSSSPT
jgi:Domain of unknown function (DUF151)/D-ala D-ala ligase C-terminus